MTKPKVTSVESGSNTADKPDSWSLESLRLPTNYTETAGVKKLLLTLKARKPMSQEFVRVHPDEAFRMNLLCVDYKPDSEIYILTQAVAPEYVGETVTYTIYLATTRSGIPFLWPVRLPGADDKPNDWWRSAREAAEHAMAQWVRVKANMEAGFYDVHAATGTISDPTWPEHTFLELLKISFRDRMIDRVDHPLIQKLRGK
jgi:hypothetical protein